MLLLRRTLLLSVRYSAFPIRFIAFVLFLFTTLIVRAQQSDQYILLKPDRVFGSRHRRAGAAVRDEVLGRLHQRGQGSHCPGLERARNHRRVFSAVEIL